MSETIISKYCFNCNEIKPISEFSKNRNRKDDLQTQCKTCGRTYQQSEKGKLAHNKANRRYSRTDKFKTIRKAYEKSRPNQLKAKSAVNDAIKLGKLISPKFLLCHYCPKPAQQYHHWHGYEKEHWLDVVPVCRKCHKIP